MHITIIDDNEDLLETYKASLDHEFKSSIFSDPLKAIEYVKENPTDAILLDIHIPGTNGYELFEQIKAIKPMLPVIFLTGDGALPTKLKGLNMGADDFLTKPVDMMELAARIKNRIMLQKKSATQNKLIQFKDIVIDLDAHQVTLAGQSIKLTPKEYQLLVVLAQNPNRVIHKDDLLVLLWKDVHVEVNNLDTHFSNLRKKIKPFSSHIKTLKNLGYVLRI